ncbi:MFS transporter [Alkalihalobacillus sp. 1P02AB]|uniref:MFS transporter n=1 Tax=Alkalihalobacillus sp. 1P02AB TaxID=3132260 RepID=UPI0039A4E49E
MLLRENTPFRYLFIARLLSVFADAVIFFSLLKWLELQTDLNDMFIYYYVAFYLPVFLLSLPIGAWIHHKTLQKVMSYSKLVIMICLIMYVIFEPHFHYFMIYVLLGLISISSLFFFPANQSLLPYLVQPEKRTNANSLLQLGYTIMKIGGQIFTAWMIKLSVSPLLLLFVSSVLLALTIIAISKIKPLIKNQPNNKQSQTKMILSSLSYVWHHTMLKPVFLLLTCAMLFISSVDLLLVTFLTEELKVGVENLSFIGTASLVGVAVGAILIRKIGNRVQIKVVFIFPMFVLSLSIGMLYFVTHWLMILPFFFIQGIALGAFQVKLVTFLQNVILPEHYTRTFSLMNVISTGSALPGILLTGLLLSYLGVTETVIIIAVCIALIGIGALFFLANLSTEKVSHQKTG